MPQTNQRRATIVGPAMVTTREAFRGWSLARANLRLTPGGFDLWAGWHVTIEVRCSWPCSIHSTISPNVIEDQPTFVAMWFASLNDSSMEERVEWRSG